MRFGFVLLLCISMQVFGAVYYVDYVGGNDASAGTSPATAWKHIPWDSRAGGTADSTALQPGDVVCLKPDTTYTAPASGIQINANGSPGAPIMFTGSPAAWGSGTENAVCEHPSGSSYVGFWTHNTGPHRHHVTIADMRFQNTNRRFIAFNARSGVSDMIVSNCFFTGTIDSKGPKWSYATNCFFDNCTVISNSQSGFSLEYCRDVVVRNSRFLYNDPAGTGNNDGLIFNDCLDFTVSNCVAYGNCPNGDGSGFDCSIASGGPNRGTWINCLSYHNGNGFSSSSDNRTGPQYGQTYINCIASGGYNHNFFIYESMVARLYNCVSVGDASLPGQFWGYRFSTSVATGYMTNCIAVTRGGKPTRTICVTSGSSYTGNHNYLMTGGSAFAQVYGSDKSWSQWQGYGWDTVGSENADALLVLTGAKETPAYYRPSENSPCIATGARLTEFDYDFLGVPRPQTGPWDIGAFQASARPLPPKNLHVAASSP